MLFSALAGFAFAKLRFRGRRGLLILDPGNPTLPVALQQLQAAYFVEYPLVLNGVVLMALPLIVLFVFAGKQLVSGIMQGAVKG